MIEVREPCHRPCDVEWCSLVCFIRRDYMYNGQNRGWIKDENGNVLIKSRKPCDWEPKEEENDH